MSSLKNLEEAHALAAEFLTRKFSKQETIEQIEHYRKVKEINETTDLDDTINRLQIWLESEELNSGRFNQSLNELILELIEFRALYHAFIESGKTNAEFFDNDFFETALFQQWKMGGVYIMYTSLSKLVSYGTQDKSLIKLWSRISSFIENTLDKKEFDYITAILSKENDKRFVNATSDAIKYRNKVIAHNQLSLEPELEELDKDVRELVRVWGLIILFHCEGILLPFRKNEIAFSGFSQFFDFPTLQILYKNRQSYIDGVYEWSRTNLVSGEVDSRGPFMNLKFKLVN